MSFTKYEKYPRVENFKREWANKSIEKAPIYCSVDLRDGNQALINPLFMQIELSICAKI